MPENTSHIEDITSMYLKSTELVSALAQAILAPIQGSLMYKSIGKKLLMADEFPMSYSALCERDIAVRNCVIPVLHNHTSKNAEKTFFMICNYFSKKEENLESNTPTDYELNLIIKEDL